VKHTEINNNITCVRVDTGPGIGAHLLLVNLFGILNVSLTYKKH